MDVSDIALERQRNLQKAATFKKDIEMGHSVRERLIEGAVPEELASLAHNVVTALSFPPGRIAGDPASKAYRKFKKMGRNPKEIGASWNALKRALRYEISQTDIPLDW